MVTRNNSQCQPSQTRNASSWFLTKPPELAIFSSLPETDCEVFDLAIKVVFYHEGYYSNDPQDSGGATKWGWSLRAAKQAGDLDLDGLLDFDIDLDGDVDISDIQALEAKEAVQLYKLHYWHKNKYDLLPEDIAIKAFDLAVVMGAPQAHKLLQRAVRAASGAVLADDGIIGTNTKNAINKCDMGALIAAYRSEAAGFFRLISTTKPKNQKFLSGWLNRAYF